MISTFSKEAEPSPTPPTRFLVVEDHPLMRRGLVELVQSEPDFSVCGEAADSLEAMEVTQALKPDFILTDITLPGKSGIELVRDIQKLQPDVPILVISMHDESVYAERVLRAGGRGYIMKQEGGRKIMDAIRRILSGKIYLSERMSGEFLEGLARPSASDGGSLR